MNLVNAISCVSVERKSATTFDLKDFLISINCNKKIKNKNTLVSLIMA